MRNIIVTFLFLFAGITVLFSQEKIKWPDITKESKPWARWWWMGSAVNDSDLTYNMELYHKAGIGGLEITPIYGVKGYEKEFINFLSPQWLKVFKHTLNEAKRLGLGIDLANATGWPFGGPWVMEDDVCKYITYNTYTLSEGQSLKDTISYMQKPILRLAGPKVEFSEIVDPVSKTPELQKKALDQVRFRKSLPIALVIAYNKNGQTIDLTTKVSPNGILNWVAPAGEWTIYALFQGKHGKLVERAAPGGEGDVIDHFSDIALTRYLEHFDNAFRGFDLTGLRGYFNDSYEVDDANGQSNWTPTFFDEFYKRRGYDLKNHLPALFGKDTLDKNNRILCDYRETVSDLIYEHFTNQWHNWAVKQGKIVRNQAHGSPANILDLYATVDIPEIEGTNQVRLKFASSASNIMGKKYASSEAATWLNEHFLSTLGDVKKAMDLFLLAGINHNFYHGINYSPKSDPWPGWLFYASVHFQPTHPFWNHFSKLNTYITRCQSFLQQGKSDNDILLYFPIYDSWSEPSKEMLRHYDGLEKNFDKTTIKSDAEYLLEKGYGYDFVSDRMLQKTKAVNNLINTPGNDYQTIIIPEAKVIPVQTAIKLLELAENGATVIFHKSVPQDVPGYSNLQSRQQTLNKLLSSINTQKINTIQRAEYGKGIILIGDSINTLVEEAKIRREKMFDNGVQCLRRKTNNGIIYFLTNSGNKDISDWIEIANKVKSAALFNPLTGESGIARIRNSNSGNSEIFLHLQPGESIILKISNYEFSGRKYSYFQDIENKTEITGSWNISFTDGGPVLPSAINTPVLKSWTEFEGVDYKRFSGTATYEITFNKPGEKCNAWILDFGKVHESAEVILNGLPLDTLIGPVYKIVIPKNKLKSTNNLKIKVANLMANRIVDLDKNGVQWKKFYNTNFQTRVPENRDEKGIFTAARWQPKPSGLIGPVFLIPQKEIK